MRTHRRFGEWGGVYLGLNVPATPAVARQAAAVCDRYKLTLRSELHVTLLYIDRITPGVFEDILAFMRGAKHILPSTLTLETTGIVAVSRFEEREFSGFECIGDADFDPARHRSRAAWWTVQRSPLLDRLRHRCAVAMTRNGLDPRLRDEWTPHVTLGSNGDPVLDWMRWLTADLPRPGLPIDIPFPEQLSVDRLHLTNAERHPGSLGVVWGFKPEQQGLGHISTTVKE